MAQLRKDVALKWIPVGKLNCCREGGASIKVSCESRMDNDCFSIVIGLGSGVEDERMGERLF